MKRYDGRESNEGGRQSKRRETAGTGEYKYRLFIALAKDDEKETAEEEEDIGSEDEDEDEAAAAQAEGLEVVEWGERKCDAATAEKVRGMSRRIYDSSDEGLCEINSAMASAESKAKAKDGGCKDRAESDAGVDVIGMVVLREPSHDGSVPAEITQLFVEPQRRDSGVGSELVDTALVCARDELGAATVECFAVGGSARFYSAVGFRTLDRGAKVTDRCEMVFVFAEHPQDDEGDGDDDGDEDEDK